VPSTKRYVHPRGSDGGINLREHFASMAMQGMLANPGRESAPYDQVARDAVSMADALIADLYPPSPRNSSAKAPS
jgi:hypothetical protein